MLHHPVQHHRQLPQHPLHRLVRKPAPLVRQPEARPCAHHRHQVQRIVRPLLRLHSHHLQPRIPTLRPVHRIVFKHHDALKQRQTTRHPAPALHLHQRRILVLPHLYLLRLQPLQPLHYFLGLPLHLHPHRQRVDEHAHHPLHSRQLPRPPRYRRSKHHICLAPAVAAQQPSPPRLHQRVHRQPLLPRKPLDPLPSLSRDLQLALPVPFSTPHRPAHPQPRWPFHPFQRFPPVPFRFPDILTLQPLHVFAIGLGLRHPPPLPTPQRLIRPEHFLQNHRQTPAIQQQMTPTPHQPVAPLSHSDQRQPHQRRFCQIKPALPF